VGLSLTRQELLLVVRGDDIFARDWVIQLTLRVREESRKKVVEQAGGDEGVDVSDGEAMHVLMKKYGWRRWGLTDVFRLLRH
jgi:hypothetical protein